MSGSQSKGVPVIYSPEYLAYDFGPNHPFTPVRLEMLLDLLNALGFDNAYRVPKAATREDLLTVHSEAFVRRVEAASRGDAVPDLQHYGLGTPDTPTFPEMDKAARRVVGGTLTAAEMIIKNEARMALQLGGGLHHAQRDLAAGFCVYNDLSVAIRKFTSQGLRVAYLDMDVHHGDGVQWIHYQEENVLTISFHESGKYLFPGTGDVHEIGRGEGVGRSLNVPLQPFTQDQSYIEVFHQVSEKALGWFRPDVLVVQCGTDAHVLDPLAELLLTGRAYQQLFSLVRQYAEAFAGGRALYTLGGGYSLDATSRVWALLWANLQGTKLAGRVPEDWARRWEEKMGVVLTREFLDPLEAPVIPRKKEIEEANRRAASKLLEIVGPYWR